VIFPGFRVLLLTLFALLLAAGRSFAVTEYRVEVVSRIPHDKKAFTQGLLIHDGKIYESTGLYGESTLRRVNLTSGTLELVRKVPQEFFAEGLALVGDRLIQLTWREGKALVYDVATLERTGEYDYAGEGWGLCFDGRVLYMSDGSASLNVRDPATFGELARIPVTLNGRPVPYLNELEFIGNRIYANVWQTDVIVMIDPATGGVDGVVNATGLLSPAERKGADVLNGIAHDPVTGKTYITGKLWPTIFEVRFVPSK